jgi:hypothetical protein
MATIKHCGAITPLMSKYKKQYREAVEAEAKITEIMVLLIKQWAKNIDNGKLK